MAKSTQVITDLTSATTTAFGATAQAAAQNPSLIMQDLVGQAQLALIKAKELQKLLNEMVLDSSGATTNAVVKSGDPNFTVLDSVRQVLV